MTSEQIIRSIFLDLGEDFLSNLNKHAITKAFPARKNIFAAGDRVFYMPILLKGLVKVYLFHDGKEILYYYMKPYDSCIMTFSTIFGNPISKIYASTEKSSEVLLLPVKKILEWITDYPQLNYFFHKEYDKRFQGIMEMVTQSIFLRLDQRILNLLHVKIEENGGYPVKISHKEIANILGTAREVVSRIMKKYENQGIITKTKQHIRIM